MGVLRNKRLYPVVAGIWFLSIYICYFRATVSPGYRCFTAIFSVGKQEDKWLLFGHSIYKWELGAEPQVFWPSALGSLSFKKHTHFFKSSKGSDGDGRRGPKGGPVHVPYTEEGLVKDPHWHLGMYLEVSMSIVRAKPGHQNFTSVRRAMFLTINGEVCFHMSSIQDISTCYRNHGGGKRQVALGNAEQQSLFSTGAGWVESPSEADRPAFVLGIFYTGQTSGSSELSR